MDLNATAISYGICAVAYALAVALILPTGPHHKYKGLLLAACGLTAFWASAVAISAALNVAWLPLSLTVIGLEPMHSASWIVVAGFAILSNCKQKFTSGISRALTTLLVATVTYSVVAASLGALGYELPLEYRRGIYFANVVLAIISLLLTENLFRNSDSDARWATKYLCFGLGITFSYDFVVYAEAMLLGHLDENFYAARGVIAAISMPLVILFAARSRSWLVDVHVSRNFVFHSVTLLAAGTYLIVLALAGYALRVFDGPWGVISQSFLLMAALLLLVVLLSSGQMQARLKTFISHNFFTYKYDYRVEWLRFVNGVSDSSSAVPLPQRVAQALANIIGASGGGVWVRDDDAGVFKAAGLWNLNSVQSSILVSEPWLADLALTPGVLDVRRKVVNNSNAFAASLPQWLAEHTQASAVMPLLHANSLIGFAVLGEMRAPRSFDWEDLDLLMTASRHAAGYIAEDIATLELEQVKRLDEFNRRFAFIVHDVKNLAGQMTLILRNAERHGDNPAFQADMMQTIARCVSRLRAMMEQLKNPCLNDVAPTEVDLVALLQGVTHEHNAQHRNIAINLPDGPINIVAQVGQLRAVITHLIQNAADAVGAAGKVDIELHIEGIARSGGQAKVPGEQWWAIITVADDGPGMDSKYIENDLFRPLQSTKTTGFGIGAFQARQITRELGGRLEVDSKCGLGTRMCVRLPYTPPTSAADETQVSAQPLSQLLRSA